MTDTQDTPATHSRLLTLAANIITYIFHPVFMPVIMMALVYLLSPASFAGVEPFRVGQWFIILTFLSVFFPLFTLFLLWKLQFVESIQLRTAKDRIIPLMATMIFYFWSNMVFGNIKPAVPMVLHLITLSSFWGIIILFLVNIFFKVSMHTAAAGSLVALMVVLVITSRVNMVVPLFIALLVAGAIGTSRRILGAHGNSQIWLGYAIGTVVTLAAFVYLK